MLHTEINFGAIPGSGLNPQSLVAGVFERVCRDWGPMWIFSLDSSQPCLFNARLSVAMLIHHDFDGSE